MLALAMMGDCGIRDPGHPTAHVGHVPWVHDTCNAPVFDENILLHDINA